MTSLMRELENSSYYKQRQENIVKELLKKNQDPSPLSGPDDRPASARRQQRREHLFAALPPPPQLVMPAGVTPFPINGDSATANPQLEAARMLLSQLPGYAQDAPKAGKGQQAGGQRGGELEQADGDRPQITAYKKRTPEPGNPPLFDFGPSHVPGWLVAGPGGSDATLTQLPAKSGLGMRLRPAHMSPGSCVPPPFMEPTSPADRSAGSAMTSLDSLRLLNPERVINTLVYDSLEAPKRGGERELLSVASDTAVAEAAEAAVAGADGDSAGALAARAAAAAAGGAAAGAQSSPAAAADLMGLLVRSESMPNVRGTAAAAASSERGGAASDNDPSAASSSGRRFGYFDDLPPWYSPVGTHDTTLVFESRFESGNLRRAVQVYPFEYDLVLHPDINTRGHTQWFYFAVSNTRAGVPVKLNIINLMKDDSLYNDGMLPLVHSKKEMACSGLGWHRDGSKVAYYSNTVPRGRRKRYATLTFTLTFAHDFDLVHIAHCYPYTYTDLQRALAALEQDPVRRLYVRRETLCSTLAGNICDVLTITSPGGGTDTARRPKRGVLVSGRVHPGETNASWMMKGVIDFLTGPSLDARLLRDHFVFRVIPMLNPDGVVVGNYRCSLAGMDLNRVWNEPSRKLHPTIHAAKAHAKAFSEERELTLFVDLHGHSRKKGIFMYGCEKAPKDLTPGFPGWPVPGSQGGAPGIPLRFQEKVLPLLLHHNLPDLFSYNGCNFKVQKSKAGTGRVVGFRELGLVNALTLEASFCGAAVGRWAGVHFNTWHLEQMGAAVVTSLLDYWDPDRYGMQDLLAELDYLHPEGEAARKVCLTADGQYLEVEDEDLPTDSDDSESDAEERRRARDAARKQRMQQQRAARAAAAAAMGGGHGSEGGAAAYGPAYGGPGGTAAMWQAGGAGAGPVHQDREAWQAQGRQPGAGTSGAAAPGGGGWMGGGQQQGEGYGYGHGPGASPLQQAAGGRYPPSQGQSGGAHGGAPASPSRAGGGAGAGSGVGVGPGGQASWVGGGGGVQTTGLGGAGGSGGGSPGGAPRRSGTASGAALTNGGGPAAAAAGADSEPELPSSSKVSRKAARRRYDRALLAAEQVKAAEGLAACLPVIAARTGSGLTFQGVPKSGAAAAAWFAAGSGGDAAARAGGKADGSGAGGRSGGWLGSSGDYASADPNAEAGGLGGSSAARGLTAAAGPSLDPRMATRAYMDFAPATKIAADALEYSKARGIYRGEELSWANTGLSVLPPPPQLPAYLTQGLPRGLPFGPPHGSEDPFYRASPEPPSSSQGGAAGAPLSPGTWSSWGPGSRQGGFASPRGAAPPSPTPAAARPAGAAGVFGLVLGDRPTSTGRRRNSYEVWGPDSPGGGGSGGQNALLLSSGEMAAIAMPSKQREAQERETHVGLLKSDPLLQR